jgi:hypothetical protein
LNEVRVSGLKHQRRSAAMEHYAGLDVSMKETSVCIIDAAGKVIHEVKDRWRNLNALDNNPPQ